MHEDLHLVSDLALILISAGVITLIFKWLKQPLILGYIVAGFLVGPHFDLFPNVADTAGVEQWSEIGIIFLLFALGLEFSFKKLMNVGSSALITAGTIFICMFLTGLGLGRVLGWSSMESIFLGGMLSMSSTTIIIKAFDDLGVKKHHFATIVFGTLVVEDLLAILLMVLLSTAAVSQRFSGGEMVQSMLKLVFFLMIWFLVGIYIIPSFLRRVHKFMNDETVLILAVGLCFGMVMLASYAGFSSALGAFVMGSILAETIEGERMGKLVKVIKDLFGAIFFVSVGMMVDPGILVEYWKPVLVITVIVISGLTIFGTTGVLISGQPLKTAVRSGFSLSQIGEFAFIIASLGVSLGVMRGFIYPVIVAVSVVTTFTTPYFIRMSEPVSNYLEKKLPKKWLEKLNRYASGSLTSNRQSDWKKLLKSYCGRIMIYGVLLVAIILVCFKFMDPFVSRELAHINPLVLKWIKTGITIGVMAPFIFGLSVNRGSFSSIFTKLWSESYYNRGALVALLLLRSFLAVAFTSSVFFYYFKFSYWAFGLIVISIAAFIIISRNYIHRFGRMEKRFMANLNEKEELEKAHSPLKTSINTQLFGHNIHLANITVSPDSPYLGMKLKDAPFRKEFGVNIVQIQRGNQRLHLPSGDDVVYPFDVLQALGTDEQIAAFTKVMEDVELKEPSSPNQDSEVVISSLLILPGNSLIGKSLILSGIRDFGFLVVGIERGSKSIMNPDAKFSFETYDRVWLAGEKAKLRDYIESQK